MVISRDRYDKAFAQVNASWSYENNALSPEEKEVIYEQLNNRAPLQSSQKMGRSVMKSEYLYPGTNVLINHFNIMDETALQRQERMSTGFRALEMRLVNPVKQSFDLNHLKNIHQHLFQDVYSFAGQIRTTNIGKNGFWFCDVAQIDKLGSIVFNELKSEKFLKGLNQEAFAERASYFYTEINFMHPFREGNGRAIREFFTDLAKHNGMELHWDRVPTDEYMHAVKLTDDPKLRDELTTVINKCLSPIESRSQVLWKDLEEPMKLKDILKIPEGLPKGADKLNVETLNRKVDRYGLDPDGMKIRIRFEGEKTIRTLPMEKKPFLNTAERNQLLDQAAQNTPAIQLNRFMEQ